MNFVAQDISAQIMMLETRALKTMTARGFDRRVAEAASLAAPVTRGSVVATQGLRAVIGGNEAHAAGEPLITLDGEHRAALAFDAQALHGILQSAARPRVGRAGNTVDY